jgi:hypothetical protein
MTPLFATRWGIKGLDVSPSGTLFGITNRRNSAYQRQLVTIDPISQQVTPIGPSVMAGTTNECNLADIAFNGPTLYGLRENGYPNFTLTTIDPATGACTDVSATAHNFGTQRWVGLEVKDASTFYVVGPHQGNLYQIATNNTLTGSLVAILGPNNRQSGGAVLLGGLLWSVGRYRDGGLITIEPATGVVEPILPALPVYIMRGFSRTPPSMGN